MIRLDTTTRKLQILLGGAVTTSQLPVVVAYADRTATAFTGASQLSNTNGATPVDICASPAASAVRDVDYLSVRNSDTVSATVTVRYNDNATLYTIVSLALASGDDLVFTHATGWRVLAASGAVKNAVGSASDVTYTPTGGIAATNVQAALTELDTEKATLLAPSFTGTVSVAGAVIPAANGVTDVGDATHGLKRVYVDYTNTATIGAVTISKAAGRVNVAAAGTSVVVTNTLVTAASHVSAWASTNDATARVTSVVPAAGSFTIFTVATTAQTSFDFQVISTD